MKTGILGGTFNPPHNGHKRLALEAYRRLGLDRVIIMPSCIPPHKAAAALAGAKDRMEMCSLEFPEPFFEVSDIEINRGDRSYTVETLHILHDMYPKDDFYFIIGSDMLETFTQWYRWEEILSLCTICAASRKTDYKPDLSGYTEQQRKKIIFMPIEPYELSSTQVRFYIKGNIDCGDIVAPEVLSYIKANDLYDDGFDKYHELIHSMLDETRVFHSECVSESAGILAERYGADPEKAKLAGLLHDITKRLHSDEHADLIGKMTPLEKSSPKVWHQISAPVFLKSRGIVTDEEILEAIRWHTTGKAGMTLLSKIVYVADYISAERDYPDVETVRKLATLSLEHAILYTSRYTVRTLALNDRPVHPATLDCYNDMLRHFGI
ncbi:MAG: nicotinate (nicotinamide) nucleotide adenylyltransferase [Clostridia bacterium]|nr:nicotinate (nicotinamide) nucleotide adenylyltransferase [Clostridia bacterium]